MKRWGMMLLFLTVTILVGVNTFGQNKLTGVINYHDISEFPMPNVNVGLYDLQDVLIESTWTNENGVFTFDSLDDGNYLLKSSSNYEPSTIDLEDAQMVLLYLLGYIELTEVQLVAADINTSGSVSWADYIYIIVNYLMYGQPFPAGDWQFEEFHVNLSSRAAGDTATLWGTATGEVELDWEPSGRSIYEVSTALQQYQVNPNEDLQINIETNYHLSVSGFSMDVSFPSEMIDIIDVQGPDENLNYSIDKEEGILKLSWLNETNSLNSDVKGDKLVTLTIQTNKNDINESAFTLLPGTILLDEYGDKVDYFEVRLPSLRKSKDVDFEFQVSTYPNPAVDKINVSLTLPDANYGSLYIYDLSGRLVSKMENLSLAKGVNSFSVNTQHFISGHYFYVVKFRGNLVNEVKGRFFKSE